MACVAWIGAAAILLFAGIAVGSAFTIVPGFLAVAVALFVLATRGPVYTTYRCGICGEQALRANLIALELDNDYTAYYNLPLNDDGGVSDIDCVLVGPSGVFVFEVKHHNGVILYRNKVWARIKVGRRGSPYWGRLGDPSGQLYRNVRKLKELLGRHRIEGLWLHGIIVFTNPLAVVDVEGLRWVRTIALRDLRQVLSRRTVLSAEQINSINTRLSILVRK